MPEQPRRDGDAPRDGTANLEAEVEAVRRAAKSGPHLEIEWAARAYRAAYYRALIAAAWRRVAVAVSAVLRRTPVEAHPPRHGPAPSRTVRTRFVLALAGGLAVCPPAFAAEAGPLPDLFWIGADHAGLLIRPAHRPAPGGPAVVLLHDALGADLRAEPYIDQLVAAGLAVLVLELRALSPDGTAGDDAGDSASEGAARATEAAVALVRDARFGAGRIGALGFGAGARAALLAPRAAGGAEPFAARALLYPGCRAANDALASAASERADRRVSADAAVPSVPRTLLLHGDADLANLPRDCAKLAAALAERGSVRLQTFEGAGYGWDTVPLGPLAPLSSLPAAGAPNGRVVAAPWPELTSVVSGRVAAFLVNGLEAREPSLLRVGASLPNEGPAASGRLRMGP